MRIDGRSILDGATIDTDICIVGGGPAGLVLARELASCQAKIMVLESGSTNPGPRAMEDVDLEPSGAALEPARASRWRQLGGTAAIWNTYLHNQPAARYLRLDAQDFQRRTWIDHSGWPFELDDLLPYYNRAEATVLPRGHERLLPISRSQFIPLQPDIVETVIERFGLAAVFTKKLPRLFDDSPNVTLVTNATATEILSNEHGKAGESLQVTSSGSERFKIRYRVLVLAAGGVENARLLLLSRGSNPAGLGNGDDQVGRYFMDHQRIAAGHLIPTDPAIFDHTAAYDFRSWQGQYAMGKLKLSESIIKKHRILNSSILLWPRPGARDENAVESLKTLLELLRNGKINREAAVHFRRLLAGSKYLLTTSPVLAFNQRNFPPVIDRGSWSHLRNNRRRFESFELLLQCEQAPNPDNRVSLGKERDKFGLPRARVESCWSAIDLESIRETHQILANEFERSGVGRLISKNEAAPNIQQPGGIHHHLGTTRMHADPRHGVVDNNARIHGLANVFIAGGSVFPTGGYANPTLTIVALAIRLADHIKDVLPAFADKVGQN